MWAITPEERGKHDKQFDSLAPLLGYVSGRLLSQQIPTLERKQKQRMCDILPGNERFLLFFRRTSPEVLPPVRPASSCPG